MLDMLTYLNLIMDLKRLRSGLRLSETVISVQGPKFSVALSERATARNNRVVRNNHGEFEERETIITVVRGVSNKNGEKTTFQHSTHSFQLSPRHKPFTPFPPHSRPSSPNYLQKSKPNAQ